MPDSNSSKVIALVFYNNLDTHSKTNLNVAVFLLFLGDRFDSKTRRISMGSNNGESISGLKFLSYGKGNDRRFVLLHEMPSTQANVPGVTF